MNKCSDCRNFHPIPETDLDYEIGRGDCVREEKDDKGKYWLGKPTTIDEDAGNCQFFVKKVVN